MILNTIKKISMNYNKMEVLFNEYSNIIPNLSTLIEKPTTVNIDSCVSNFEKKYTSTDELFDNLRITDFSPSNPLFSSPFNVPFQSIIDLLFIIYLKKEEKISLESYVENTSTINKKSAESELQLLDLGNTSSTVNTSLNTDVSVLDKLKKKYTRTFLIWYCKQFRGNLDLLKSPSSNFYNKFHNTFNKINKNSNKKFIDLTSNSNYGSIYANIILFIHYLNKLKLDNREEYTKTLNEISSNKDMSLSIKRFNTMYDDFQMAKEVILKNSTSSFKPIDGLSCFEQLFNKSEYFKLLLSGNKKYLSKYLNTQHNYTIKTEFDKTLKYTILDSTNKIIGANLINKDSFTIYTFESTNKTEDIYQISMHEEMNKNGKGKKKLIDITCTSPKSDDKINKITISLPYKSSDKKSLFNKNPYTLDKDNISLKINDSKYFTLKYENTPTQSIQIFRNNENKIITYNLKSIGVDDTKKLYPNYDITNNISLVDNFDTTSLIPFEMIIAQILAIVINAYIDVFETNITITKKKKSLFETKKENKVEEKFEKVDYLNREYADY